MIGTRAATGKVAPPAITGAVTATKTGDRTATVSFTPLTDKGKYPITGYDITMTSSDATVNSVQRVIAAPATYGGLPRGKTLTYKIKAVTSFDGLTETSGPEVDAAGNVVPGSDAYIVGTLGSDYTTYTATGYKAYRVYTNATVTVNAGNYPPENGIRAAVVGGGGGGGYASSSAGGGGGGGGVVNVTWNPSPNATTTASVSDGGAGGFWDGVNLYAPTSGGNSSFAGNTAIGGGRGGYIDVPNGTGGGSGGGASCRPSFTYSGGAGTAGQGNAGSNATYVDTNSYSGGGGGAGGAGGLPTGGAGLAVGPPGFQTTVSRGGDGKSYSQAVNGSGTSVYGNGGGGGGYGGSRHSGGTGGPGTVIIWWEN